jgi:hypothetical protein
MTAEDTAKLRLWAYSVASRTGPRRSNVEVRDLEMLVQSAGGFLSTLPLTATVYQAPMPAP